LTSSPFNIGKHHTLGRTTYGLHIMTSVHIGVRSRGSQSSTDVHCEHQEELSDSDRVAQHPPRAPAGSSSRARPIVARRGAPSSLITTAVPAPQRAQLRKKTRRGVYTAVTS